MDWGLKMIWGKYHHFSFIVHKTQWWLRIDWIAKKTAVYPGPLHLIIIILCSIDSSGVNA